VRSCQYCSSEKVAPLGWFNRFLELPDESVGAYVCRGCGLVQRYALPDESQCPEWKTYGEYTAGTDEILPRMVDRLRELEAAHGKGTLLDVGAATGSFIDAAAELGWDALGVELPGSGSGRDDILELDITKDPIPSLEEGSVHVVHAHHVLEHVADIRGFLSACFRYLCDTGVFVLEVPNELASLAIVLKRMFGLKYDSRTAFMSHRFFFRRSVLRRILVELGMRILLMRTPFTCHNTSYPHRMFDRLQSGMGMGNSIEVHCAGPAGS
jgi:2-polyprenyl-3-methyl-5-hydroxy-6-metoxy-1,4-benzoquinol methylase